MKENDRVPRCFYICKDCHKILGMRYVNGVNFEFVYGEKASGAMIHYCSMKNGMRSYNYYTILFSSKDWTPPFPRVVLDSGSGYEKSETSSSVF